MNMKEFFLNLFEEKRELRRTIASLEEQIACQAETIRAFQEKLAEANTHLQSKYEDWAGPAVVDFATMSVCSIERNKKDEDHIPVTIIGYIGTDPKGNPKVKEWFLAITEEEHQRLVDDFREYISDRKPQAGK